MNERASLPDVKKIVASAHEQLKVYERQLEYIRMMDRRHDGLVFHLAPSTAQSLTDWYVDNRANLYIEYGAKEGIKLSLLGVPVVEMLDMKYDDLPRLYLRVGEA